MCVISLIMIAMCIPNQMKIAKAQEGKVEEQEVKVIEISTGKEWEKENTRLNIFPNTIEPGNEDDYGFIIKNETKEEIEYCIEISRIEEGDSYPVEYKLYKREGNKEKEVWEGWKNPKDSLEEIIIYEDEVGKGKEERYVLSWKFKEEDSLYNRGKYTVNIKVEVKQKIEDEEEKEDTNSKDENNSGEEGNIGNKPNEGNQNNNQTSSNKGTVNTSDITTPVMYVAIMIMSIGIIMIIKTRKEKE